MNDNSNGWKDVCCVIVIFLVVPFAILRGIELIDGSISESPTDRCRAALWTDAVTAPNGDTYCVRWDPDGTGHIVALERLEEGE